MTLAVCHDFPGLENGLTKLHDFSGRVVTLTTTAIARPPTLRPSWQSWAVSPPIGCYHPHTYRHSLLLLGPKDGIHFTIPPRVGSWVDLSTSVRVFSPGQRLYITMAIMINKLLSAGFNPWTFYTTVRHATNTPLTPAPGYFGCGSQSSNLYLNHWPGRMLLRQSYLSTWHHYNTVERRTLSISVKPKLFWMRTVFSEMSTAIQSSRWKFWHGRPVHNTLHTHKHTRYSKPVGLYTVTLQLINTSSFLVHLLST